MKQITASCIPALHEDTALRQVSDALDRLPQHAVDALLWSEVPEAPEVRFSIAYHKSCIFLKYYVQERRIQARHRQTNAPVYNDSCVEFFIAFNGEPAYYNLEFNCLGTCLAGFGQNKQQRTLLPGLAIAQIRHVAQLHVSVSREITWELTLAIPSRVFTQHAAIDLKGTTSRGNFYKCGDALPAPHYLAWNAVRAPAPNFHLPEFFGEIHFV